MIGVFLPPSALDVSKIKYALNFIKIFDKRENQKKILILVYKKDIDLLGTWVKYLQIVSFNFNKYKNKILRISGVDNEHSFLEYETAIKNYGIKFAIFPSAPAGIINCKIPYATSIQSIGHRLNPELLETSLHGLWKIREDSISTLCKNAKLIFIDSEVGKEYLKFYYNAKSEIVVLPHNLPDSLDIAVAKDKQSKILKKFGISKKYLFYPAQLWPHKNHVRILEALRYLKKKNMDLQLVFTASSKSVNEQFGIEYILKRIAKDSGIEDDLIITGYLDDVEMKTLYLNAFAMIMPQLIPEPCIPLVEAMGLKCPVITSNIPGLKDQIYDCGVLVDPYDIKSIAEGIESLLEDQVRNRYIREGFNKFNSLKDELQMLYSVVENKVLCTLCHK